MNRFSILGAALAVAAILAPVTSGARSVSPFPSPTVGDIFVAAQTVTSDGALANWFTPGSSVVFRAYAVNPKTHSIVDPKTVKYFYVTIPDQPNVKLKYGATAPGASTGMPWTGTWNVPATYANGTVNFKILIQVKGKNGKQLKGQFVQMPVVPAQLTISATAPPITEPGVPAGNAGAGTGQSLNLALYVDTVAGTGPVGIAKRPIGCTQTNVYKRGEQVVVRTWGTDLATGNVLTNDNVNAAHITVAGMPDATLNYGAHGVVYFWSAPFNVPANYPLGATTIHVVFSTESGKTGTFDYVINVIPS